MPVKRNEIGAFMLSKLSDVGLAQLQQDVNKEIMLRELAKEQRSKWIKSHVREFRSSTANHEIVDKTVIVAVLWNGHIVIGKTTPRNSDKFDLDTGIAVAYAKAIGEHIPSYI